jgi:hypothetical protein
VNHESPRSVATTIEVILSLRLPSIAGKRNETERLEDRSGGQSFGAKELD